MRIRTITNWAYGVTVLLTGLSGAAFLMSAGAAAQERSSVEQHLAFEIMAENLVDSAEMLTDEARLYAMRGSARHLNAYRREILVEKTRERTIERVKAMALPAAELAAIAEAEQYLAELDRIETAAVADIQAGNQAAAQAQLFGPDHERLQSGAISALDHFRDLAAARTQTRMQEAKVVSDRASLAAKIMLALTALVFLSVLYFILRRRVAVPLTRMTGIVTRLARQDYTVEVLDDRRRDEIGDMNQAIAVFRENGLERDRLEAERQADRLTKDSILQMMHRLQACSVIEEMAEVVACFAPQTFPTLAGRFYVLDQASNGLVLAGSWQDPQHSVPSFAPTACWGLRRGRVHVSHGEHEDVSCPHIGQPDAKTLCVPLNAQGEIVGLLYFEDRPGVAQPDEIQHIYLELMADNVALTLANLRLRERLADLAVRDGLTGLLNRRSLDATLKQHGRQGAERLACIMIDIDHFKRFNDSFGHDAGDAVMQHVAEILQTAVGDGGGAYRFGGEEFTLLLPGLDDAAALDRCERLRAEIAQAPLAHHGRMLDHVTVSLGLAVSPDDGPTATLLQRADAALLQAKTLGRNRTVTAMRATGPDAQRPAA